jgi:hypothetical protein
MFKKIITLVVSLVLAISIAAPAMATDRTVGGNLDRFVCDEGGQMFHLTELFIVDGVDEPQGAALWTMQFVFGDGWGGSAQEYLPMQVWTLESLFYFTPVSPGERLFVQVIEGEHIALGDRKGAFVERYWYDIVSYIAPETCDGLRTIPQGSGPTP